MLEDEGEGPTVGIPTLFGAGISSTEFTLLCEVLGVG